MKCRWDGCGSHRAHQLEKAGEEGLPRTLRGTLGGGPTLLTSQCSPGRPESDF